MRFVCKFLPLCVRPGLYLVCLLVCLRLGELVCLLLDLLACSIACLFFCLSACLLSCFICSRDRLFLYVWQRSPECTESRIVWSSFVLLSQSQRHGARSTDASATAVVAPAWLQKPEHKIRTSLGCYLGHNNRLGAATFAGVARLSTSGRFPSNFGTSGKPRALFLDGLAQVQDSLKHFLCQWHWHFPQPPAYG